VMGLCRGIVCPSELSVQWPSMSRREWAGMECLR
jgi:hypothetical protein